MTIAVDLGRKAKKKKKRKICILSAFMAPKWPKVASPAQRICTL